MFVDLYLIKDGFLFQKAIEMEDAAETEIGNLKKQLSHFILENKSLNNKLKSQTEHSTLKIVE